MKEKELGIMFNLDLAIEQPEEVWEDIKILLKREFDKIIADGKTNR